MKSRLSTDDVERGWSAHAVPCVAAASLDFRGLGVNGRVAGVPCWPLLYVWLACVGCGGGLPALKPPPIDPAAASQAAFAQYDADGDGVIQGAELKLAPSIRFALDRIDADGDGGVTVDELRDMIQEKWLDAGDGVIRVKCQVNYRGQPLSGATVTFEPEQFLGDLIHAATGTTRNGFATLTVAEENLPHPNARGVAPGLYLVRISLQVDGQERIPAKYNSETTLGVEVANRASYMPGAVTFDLSR